MVFERLAKRLETVTYGRFAWFGEFWPYCLLIQTVGLCLLNGPLSAIVVGRIMETNYFARQLFWAVFFPSGALGVFSVLLDKRLSPFVLLD